MSLLAICFFLAFSISFLFNRLLTRPLIEPFCTLLMSARVLTILRTEVSRFSLRLSRLNCFFLKAFILRLRALDTLVRFARFALRAFFSALSTFFLSFLIFFAAFLIFFLAFLTFFFSFFFAALTFFFAFLAAFFAFLAAFFAFFLAAFFAFLAAFFAFFLAFFAD